ncbi:substrate-binding domain-containing protein [Streptomyces sp. NPDC001260]|uniref:substrate-binding domain-containing protein n=1 Tax=Streptomyces sp. NPDC001260 TaxID=3364551 RepID=UPI00367758B1
MNRLDPRGKANRALLVGVSEYDHVRPPHGVPGPLPAVAHNLTLLQEALRGGQVFGADQVTALASPDVGTFHNALRGAANGAEGLLLVYFAGHAAVPSAAEPLFLQLRGAEVYRGEASVFPGAETFDTVLGMLAASRAERIVVILDCCYAGNASHVWEQWEPFEDRRRVLLLMSVQPNHRIDAGDDTTPTPFTAELVHLLGREGEVGFGRLAADLRARMEALDLRTLRDRPWRPFSRMEAEADVLLSARGVPPEPPGTRPTLPITIRPGAPTSSTDSPGPSDDQSRLPPARRPTLPHRVRNALAVPLAALRARARRGADRFRKLSRPARIGVVLALALAVLGAGSIGVPALLRGSASCAPPLELRVLTDPDLEPTVTAAADAYLTSDANTDGHGCRRSGITVYGAGAADAVTALRRQTEDWREPNDQDVNPQRDVGPQPDVWIPATPADVDRVKEGQDTAAVAHLVAAGRPLAYSPVVLAVPDTVAAAGPRTGRPLSAMLAALTARTADFRVRRPDPEYADAALLATTGLYGTGTAKASDPGRAERLVAQAGPPSRTAADLMCALPEDPSSDAGTAALVPEFLLKTGVGCDRTTRERRTARYPDDVPGVEPTFVRVRWDHGDRDGAARDRAAEAFGDWLAGSGGRAVFARDGFRDAGHRALLDDDNAADGVLHAPSPLTEGAASGALDSALKQYRGADGPGRVLYLLDNSGSMGGLWDGPSGGPGLLRQSLGGLGSRDEFGIWTVSGLGERPYATLLPFDHYTRKAAEQAVDGARFRDAEADPPAALTAALDEMHRRGTDDHRPELIVYITDDEDDGRLTGAALDDVLNKARAGKGRVPVTMVSLVSGGCDRGRPDALISAASGGRCLDADDDLGTGLTDEVARTGTGKD